MPIERRRVYYSGRVQGVGFRFISQRLAREFQVSGSVRNLSDGRVELIAQGDAEVVSSYLEAVARELAEKIHDRPRRGRAGDRSPRTRFRDTILMDERPRRRRSPGARRSCSLPLIE